MKSTIHSRRKALAAFAFLFCLTVAGGAMARNHQPERMETVSLWGSNFWLEPGETKTVAISKGWRRVEKIFISAYGRRTDGKFEVVANGDVKGTVYVPGKDPSYVVTIGEVVNSIQFRHIGGGTVAVTDIKAVQSESYSEFEYEWEECSHFTGVKECYPPHGIEFPAPNLASSLARRAIRLTDLLEGYANYKEYGQYLLPIKKVAGRAYAVSAAKGDLSWDTRIAMMALKRQIEYAACYLNETFERSNAFELAVELASLGEKLDAVLR